MAALNTRNAALGPGLGDDEVVAVDSAESAQAARAPRALAVPARADL
jgi:hypothetical protein